MSRTMETAERAVRVTAAFTWLGVTESIAYPLMLVLTYVVGPTVHPVIYVFVSRLVDDAPNVGNDYYTFVVLGLITTHGLAGGLTAFSRALDSAIQQGRFESFLVQPISWLSLPFALASWPMIQNFTMAFVMALLGIALGASIDVANLPLALLVFILGMAACHAIGTIAAAVRLLSKRADPVISIYTLAAGVFSGALFPIDFLPPILRLIAYVIPHTYVMSAMRKVLMPDGEGIGGPSVELSVVMLVLSTAVLYAISLWLFARSLEYGRRYGILGGY